LSPREREVVQLVCEGKTSGEMAILLGVSLKTTETHRNNVMTKLSLHSPAELVMYAITNGMLQVQPPAIGLLPPEQAGPEMAFQAHN
jgi:DNA-binding CsgD family transcriptional regulator